MKSITIFTTRLGNDSVVFGFGDEIKQTRQPIINEDLVNLQEEVFNLSNRKKMLWENLDPEYQEEALKIARPEWVNNLAGRIKRVANNEKDLQDLWKDPKFKSIVIGRFKGEWSVYPAIEAYQDVYALEVRSTRWNMVEWTQSLVRIAKVLKKDATVVNLVLHNKDVVEYEKYRVCKEEELGYDNLESFKKEMGIDQLNVILFSHDSSKVMSRLLYNDQLENVYDEISKMIDEDRESRTEAMKEGLGATDGTKFGNKLKRASEGEYDPIGISYKILY